MSKSDKAEADRRSIQKQADEQRKESEVTTAVLGETQQGEDKAATKGGRVYTMEESHSYRLE